MSRILTFRPLTDDDRERLRNVRQTVQRVRDTIVNMNDEYADNELERVLDDLECAHIELQLLHQRMATGCVDWIARAMDYDFPAKQQKYRARLWSTVDLFSHRHRRTRRVIYLETKQGLETRHLLTLGYRAENLYAVNKNPAEVACLTMGLSRDGWPRVNTLGCELSDAIIRCGPLFDVVNYDGTSQLHNGLLDEVNAAMMAARGGVLAVTMLAAREDSFNSLRLKRLDKFQSLYPTRCVHRQYTRTSWNEEVNPHHAERLRSCLQLAGLNDSGLCAFHITKAKWSVYMSASRQPMAWVVGKVSEHSLDAIKRRRTSTYDGCDSLGYYPPCYVCVKRRNAAYKEAGYTSRKTCLSWIT